MIVLRKTMDAAVEKEREHYRNLSGLIGHALWNTEALQKQLADWITEKGEALTPEQFAALFYSHDDSWQAAFFNVMQDTVQTVHDALPAKRPNEFRMGPGYPAGETQWCWMADKLDDRGFETIEAMFEHAKYARDKRNGASAMSAFGQDAQRLEAKPASAAREAGDAQNIAQNIGGPSQ